MNKLNGKVIGVHVGGKGVNCAAIDLQTKSIVPGSESEGRVDKDANDRHILSLWSMQIKKSIKAIGEENVIGIGFSMPGPFDYENGIAEFHGVAKYDQLRGCNVTDELQRRLMLQNPVEMRYINDASGFGIGQDWLSSASGNKGLSIIIGEGFGTSFLSGHVPVLSGNVPRNGTVFNLPFEDSIADDYFSARGLLREFSKHDKLLISNISSLILNAKRSEQGKALFEQFGEKMGTFLAPVLKNFSPEYIAFGGMIGSELALFESSLKRVLSENGMDVTLQLPEEGDKSFMYGAARLFDAPFWNQVKPLLRQMI